MANFYTDNVDIMFLCRHYQLKKLAEIMEDDFSSAKQFSWAPADAADAVDNYDRILDVIGQISGDFIEPRAEDIDLQGNTLNDDGTVSYAPGMTENLQRLAQAQVMGFTLPYRFGGLNCPTFIYTVSNEIVSRADASLMNIYGLQGIAETINAFASEEIKQEYLPGFSEGKLTGAMVLTEPDAGSDLQAVKLRAYQEEDGQWRLHGVKRFITNGCGEVLLVLARSEPDRSGGLGLSLFVCEPGPAVKVRRLENKLGIHGSPTCEIFFNHTPCELIGERQRGLVTYVMSLMNGARVGIAAQSLGIGEAAFRVAREYAASRKQFGLAIENFPAVRDMLITMKLDIETARTLTYETCWVVDHENYILRRIESSQATDKDTKRALKNQQKKYKRLAAMLTPMSKYYASEMCNRVTYDSIQVLGGSGYMRDYASERHVRDARITTIYEGTSQLQIVAAVRGVCNGTAEKFIAELNQQNYDTDVKDLLEILAEGTEQLKNAVKFVKENGNEYMDLYGRALVDMAIELINGYLFSSQASTTVDMEVAVAPEDSGNGNNTVSMKTRKAKTARRFITKNALKIKALYELICSGDKSTLTDYQTIVGPVAVE